MARARRSKRKKSGKGRLFRFHGAFSSKERARAKERRIRGAFIRRFKMRGGSRWVVLTRRGR